MIQNTNIKSVKFYIIKFWRTLSCKTKRNYGRMEKKTCKFYLNKNDNSNNKQNKHKKLHNNDVFPTNVQLSYLVAINLFINNRDHSHCFYFAEEKNDSSLAT